jgi:hypothetical protein
MSSPTFLPVRVKDIPRLADFCANFPGDGRSVDFWMRRMRHWWLDNPAVTADWIAGSQLMVDGVLQGINLAIPLRVVVEGAPRQAALGTTWRVMPRHRAWSMVLSHQVDLYHNHLLRFNGTPNERVIQFLALTYRQLRLEIQSSQIAVHPVAIIRKALKRPLATFPLAKLILPEHAPDLKTVATSVDATWQATGQGSTGPVRDWRYWHWFSTQNPSTACSTAILPADAAKSVPALCALLVDFGDGILQVTDLWPSTAPIERITALLDLILLHARRARFHSLLVPHWNSRIADSCALKHPYRQGSLPAAVWTNSFDLPNESANHYWPLHTGDALL